VEVCGDGLDHDGDGLVDEGCPAPTPLGSPQRLTARVRQSSIAFAWLAPVTGAAATGYVLEAGLAPGQTTYRVPVAQTSLRVTDVGRGRYYVRVRAVAGAVTGPASNEVVVTVGCTTAPASPAQLTTAANGPLVTFAWTDPDGCSDTIYTLSVGTAPGAADLGRLDLSETSLSATLPPGVYYARVASRHAFGSSPAGPEVRLEVTALPCAAPAVAMRLTGRADASAVALAWSPLDETAAIAADLLSPVSYVLEAGTRRGAADLVATDVGRALSLVTTAPPGRYFVRIRPRHACGVGAPSNELVLDVG
jgi:hypothetical protein